MLADSASPTPGHVVVVGAGAAGLAASAALRAAGAAVTLIEAGARCGGRARTERPAVLAGAAFDHGASWLHDAGRNPLADLARAGGHVLLDAPEMHTARLFVDARPATPAEHDAYADAEARWRAAVLDRLAGLAPDVDTTLADAAGGLGDDPWRATLEAWEGAVIAAADADVLSVRDWHRNALGGANLRAAGGSATCCSPPTLRRLPAPACARPRPASTGTAPASGSRRPPARSGPTPASSPCRPACCAPGRSASTRRCRPPRATRSAACRWAC